VEGGSCVAGTHFKTVLLNTHTHTNCLLRSLRSCSFCLHIRNKSWSVGCVKLCTVQVEVLWWGVLEVLWWGVLEVLWWGVHLLFVH